MIISVKRGAEAISSNHQRCTSTRSANWKQIGNPGLQVLATLICSVDISVTCNPSLPSLLLPPFLDNVCRLPLSQTAPQAAARVSQPQAPISVLSNRIPFLLLVLLDNRLRGLLPVRTDGDPPQPLYLGHQCRRVPHHPLLVGHHPRPLRNEWHRPHTPYPPNTQASSTPP